MRRTVHQTGLYVVFVTLSIVVNTLLIVLRVLLSIIVFVLGGYRLLSANYEVMPYMIFSLGAMILVMGIDEIKKDRKKMGIIVTIVSIFIF